MADISVYTRIISEAERGEGVRDAIVDALEAMNTYGGNASTLEGHPASYFATASLFSALVGQVGEVDDVLIAIENGLNALKYNMGEYTLSGEGGTFTVDCTGIKGYDNLDTTKFYFELLGGSGSHPAGSWTPQQSYNGQTGVFTYTWGAMSADIRVKLWVVKPTKTAIGTGVTELYVTANGTFDAGDHAAYNPVIVQVPNTLDTRRLTQEINQNGSYHFTPEPNTAFSDATINVNVPRDEKTLISQSFTENGTYRAMDDAADGYSVVTVNVDPKVIVTGKQISQNGRYKAIDDGGDGYDEVVVNVRGEIDLAHKTISQNGTYDASSENLDGYDSVTVAVHEKELIEKTITQNGIYDPLEEDPVKDGYSKVTVNVPQTSGTYGSRIIEENGTYNASADGYDGYSSVTVNVGSGGEPALLVPRGPYIDTGVLGSTSNLKIEIDIRVIVTSEQAIFGAAWSTSGFFLMTYNDAFRFHSGGAVVDSAAITAGERYKVICTKTGLTVDQTLYSLSNPSGSDTSANVLLFATPNAQGPNTTCILYSAKIYNGDTLLKDLVPALDNQGVSCLHDTISDTYLYNSGSGLFFII